MESVEESKEYIHLDLIQSGSGQSDHALPLSTNKDGLAAPSMHRNVNPSVAPVLTPRDPKNKKG
jgi:hypothetical protein